MLTGSIKTCFLLHFTEFRNIVNYTHDLMPQYLTLKWHASPAKSHVILVMEEITLEVSIALDSHLTTAVLHFAGLHLYLHVNMFIMAEL